MAARIHTAPPNTGHATLGKTLPDVLYETCAAYENATALNQPTDGGWISYSYTEFREQSEQLALGLLAQGAERGDKVAFYLDSDVYFCIADMGCLLSGLISVPIYLTTAPEATQFILGHAEAKMLIVADGERLERIVSLLPNLPLIQTVVIANYREGDTIPDLPDAVQWVSMDSLRELGKKAMAASPDAITSLREQIDPHDIATLIYTSGTTGEPKGVILTHENISYNALTSFSGMTGFRTGEEGERGISFLPLTHVFARTLHYGYVSMGNSVYFTTPNDLVAALPEVKPTVFATVPRVLEKVYAKIQERTAEATGAKGAIAKWGLRLAQQYELGKEPTGFYKLQLGLADKLVFSKWRAVLGGRMRFVICGGAALNKDLANVFSAAGLIILQGYGLTETSPVITFNRPTRNRAGTVGEPIPAVEVMIADDGEILTRGPHVMQGYYKAEDKTAEVINADGWFHTGDIGEFTDEGYLRITDRKKSLFKLSTGKYVIPQPLENKLGIEALVEHAVVVGAGQKYCTVLLFPDQEALRTFARLHGLNAEAPLEQLVKKPAVIARYQELVDQANEGMDHWTTIKRFVIIPDQLTIDNGLLSPKMSVKRSKVRERFQQEINALYEESRSQQAVG